MQVREPVERPLDVMIAEVLVTLSSAYLAATLLDLASGYWHAGGVGGGPVVVLLGALGLAIGGCWLFWLLGGAGWPLAAAAAPVAVFSGAVLLLGTQPDAIIRVDPWLGSLTLAASTYAVVAGLFLDSPRRWRWDQRQRLREGTVVPRISPTTRAVVAALPRRVGKSRRASPVWARGTGATVAPGGRAEGTSASPIEDAETGARVSSGVRMARPRPGGTSTASSGRRSQAVQVGTPAGSGEPTSSETEPTPASPTAAPTGAPSASVGSPGPLPPVASADGSGRASDGSAPSGLDDRPRLPWEDVDDLPTSVEPRAQRSPWAWASPPEWHRDDDDADDLADRPS